MTSNSEEGSLRKPLRFELSRLFRVRDAKHSRVITPPPGVSVTGPLWFLLDLPMLFSRSSRVTPVAKRQHDQDDTGRRFRLGGAGTAQLHHPARLEAVRRGVE